MLKLATFYDHIRDIARQEQISAAQAMHLAREAGVEALEVSSVNLEAEGTEAIGRALEEAGLGVSAIPAYLNFGRDSDVERQVLPLLESAGALGTDKIMVIPGFFAPEDSPAAREEQTVRMEEGINRMADLAAGRGISLVMEDYDNETAPFSTMEGLRRFLDHCPGLSCAFDTGNFRYMGQDVRAAYDLLRDRIGHVHLKDRAYASFGGEPARTAVDGTDLYPCPVGSGSLPLSEILTRLREDGYSGFCTLEHYDSQHMLDYLRQSASWFRNQIEA